VSIVDYSKFTKAELREAKLNINIEKYPDNYSALIAEFEKRDYPIQEDVKPFSIFAISKIIAMLIRALKNSSEQ